MSNKRINALMIESSRCMGCQSCEVACKLEHELPAGPRPVKVIQIGPLQTDNGLAMRYETVTCYHCDRAACVAACPTGAMQKRPDGIVFSDPELCIGCQTCAVACPFGVPELNPATGKIAKCDGCRDRVDQGLWPSCALKCPSGCLSFGTPMRVVNDLRTREALTIVRTLAVR
ncbi:Fe-S-cluster-containing hydrogenase components 1 [Olavius algarvensis associated proteobacterium Delta 3]|nr:Fe-S-cluster-containing hydrogenase components 1 [Olavius algarvensis associated proteobacterium Delta 3]CAB5166371.1 Fe-S-cluster-containing hydrogenase components 1 [Olavius algarvensis associated proteobacterium Delta 3]